MLSLGQVTLMILFRYSSGEEVRHDSRVEEEIYKLVISAHCI